MSHARKPLYRKRNTTARGASPATGGEYRHERNTKAEKANDRIRQPMRATNNRGRDYTPMFKFLLSSVGRPWSEVYSEAVGRLDTEEPLFWVVALEESDREEVVRVGESTYYSGLFVDDAGLLQVVNPALTVEMLSPQCPCCTHTFNGVRFVKKFNRD